MSLVLEVLDAHPEAVSLRLTTAMSARFSGEWSDVGVRPGDHLALDEGRRGLINWMTRRGEVSLEDVVAHRGGNPDEARALLDELTAEGVISPSRGPTGRYRVRLAGRPSRRVPAEIWAALDARATPDAAVRSRGQGRLLLLARGVFMSERGRFALSAAPVLLVFVIAEWLLLTRTASFAGVLGFGGVIANSLTAGIFPVLLLFASRRKGDYVPGVVYRLLGHLGFTSGVCLLALANLLLHGFFIYRDPLSRGVALVFGLAAIGLITVMLRRRVFARRVVVELREDRREGATSLLAVTSAGRPLTAAVRVARVGAEESVDAALVGVRDVSTLRAVAVRLPPGEFRELKVWTHRVSFDGTSEPLPIRVEVRDAGQTRHFDLKLSGGQTVLSVSGGDCWIQMGFPEAEPPASGVGERHDRRMSGTTSPRGSGPDPG